ncbi:hypothetical protein MKZ38_006439 [Zalerion maritima]|uniref:CAP-Gly domain-containing protein n=1 Tax=Zalerion maritima TaxID=339359 RepID=A0AAD5RWG6_9PEZI|nr:hypothetical protein MKZ38_006439 [Zalerion maritima]
MSSTITTLTSPFKNNNSQLPQQQQQPHPHHNAPHNGSPSRNGLSRTPRKLPGAGGSIYAAASTPNLNVLYSSHSQAGQAASRLGAGYISRKASLAALTQGSLASIPDDSESYAQSQMMPPVTPSRSLADPVTVGDAVDVPGNMHGAVRFVGSVAGRKGMFAGVELHPDYASRGKNSGDVDGTFYFTTTIPGAGIFLPLSKAVRRDSSPTSAASSFPFTPAGLKAGNQNSTNFTPPTPSIPKFSQSVGPGRAASPAGKRPRTSLPRPDSPVRRLQLTPGPRQSIAQPTPKAPQRFGSPTASKFGRSVHAAAMDPAKLRPKLDGKASIGPRSVSALGQTTATDIPTYSPAFGDDITPAPTPQRTKTNGSGNSVSSLNMRLRPPSRTTNVNDEEVERLKSQLEDRDQQLKDQASTLAEMESSLTELQTLIEHPDGLQRRRNSLEDKDTTQLRVLLREKNEKIAMLTAEFDAHRADFRSTIDTLEMASTETERVYEKRIEELMQEIRDLQERSEDVDSVARQLKQLEELVQELEEGLEDARRGEAEARGEVEFLRGEVERTRSELRREREKASAVHSGGAGTGGASSKELEQKEDEIRGLKAIIHSLSRDSVPGDSPDSGVSMQRNSSFGQGESVDSRLAREKLEREIAELKGLVDNKNGREEELEREIETLRRRSATTQRASALTIGSQDRSSIRDSKGTVILAREPRSPENHKRGSTLDTMPESDAYSTATENSTLWCEICETAGHDILTCTNMFGTGAQAKGNGAANGDQGAPNKVLTAGQENAKPSHLSPVRINAPELPTTVKIIPNPMESGPVAGKESGVVDAGKWCAICERDGHDSVDCPFEDAF